MGSVCSDFDKKSPVFDGDIVALKDLLKDKDYAVFRQKAKELAYSGLRSKKDYSQEVKDVEQKKDQEMEEYRRAMEAMRKTREERQRKLEMLRKGVYEDKMSS
ncbi:hypothetical protein STCU_11116 [Strigomonas culicis]|uniref:Uncharacterized protein n=1 Tax=Strigomonas culicis TaxID=28005 RepID=S9TIC7_9TRYP|nr:hypothetical protein STCU_11116 [Strigomonas culicis]|eukprot:EPY16599.1 hypothetical protein STCU_11116 [Strigomonas culicis]